MINQPSHAHSRRMHLYPWSYELLTWRHSHWLWLLHSIMGGRWLHSIMRSRLSMLHVVVSTSATSLTASSSTAASVLAATSLVVVREWLLMLLIIAYGRCHVRRQGALTWVLWIRCIQQFLNKMFQIFFILLFFLLFHFFF